MLIDARRGIWFQPIPSNRYNHIMPSSSLHVLSDAPSEDLIRLFHRTRQHWAEQLAEPIEMEIGTGIFNREFSALPEANQILDAKLPDGAAAGPVLADAEQSLREKGMQCLQWTMSASAPAKYTQPIIDLLLSQGWFAQPRDILRLFQSPTALPPINAEFTVIPARAGYAHAQQLAAIENGAGDSPASRQRIEAGTLRLDDGHWDSLIALCAGAPAGRVGVLSVGELGRLEGPWIAPAFRGRGLGKILLSRAVDICARSTFRHVFAEVIPACPLVATLNHGGFKKVGSFAFYQHPGR